jgi:hypothetical protein
MGVNGSLEYALIWKAVDMPAGPPICALRARAHRISGSGCTGWPSPVSWDAWTPSTQASAEREWGKSNLRGVGAIAGWPTPVANDDNKSIEAHLAMKKRMGERDGSNANRTAITSLQVAAQLAGWPTPDAQAMNVGADPQKQASGPPATSSPASTAKRGALNPFFSLWLQGFPATWLDCLPKPASRSRKPLQGVRGRCGE